MKKFFVFALMSGLISFDLYANAQYSLQKAKRQADASTKSLKQ